FCFVNPLRGKAACWKRRATFEIAVFSDTGDERASAIWTDVCRKLSLFPVLGFFNGLDMLLFQLGIFNIGFFQVISKRGNRWFRQNGFLVGADSTYDAGSMENMNVAGSYIYFLQHAVAGKTDDGHHRLFIAREMMFQHFDVAI